jgi:hypothetical protein
MSGKVRIVVNVLVSAVLLGMLSVAQASASSDKTVNNQEHHSRKSKAAFWRHHKDAGTKAKPAAAVKAQSQKPQAKPAQLKPVSAKMPVGKNNQKPEKHASGASKSSSKKAPASGKSAAATKTKSQQKAQPNQTALVKQ